MNLVKLQDRKLQKLFTFLYANKKRSEKEIKEIPLTIASKRVNYLGINLLKEAKYLYTKNYKVLMKQIEDDTNRWRDIPCSWIGRINIVQITMLCKAIYRFNRILIKLPLAFLTELGKKNNLYGNIKDPKQPKHS